MRIDRAACLLCTIIALTLVLPAGGCEQKNELASPPPPAVFVATPRVEEMVLYDEYPGSLGAFERVEIRARVSGVLEEIAFEEGKAVERGALLFRIEREPLEAAVAEAEAALAIARAQLALSETERDRAKRAFDADAATDLEVRRVEAEVERARGQVQAAEANLKVARIDLGYAEITSPIAGRVSESIVDAGNLVGRDGPTLLTTIVDDDPIYAYFDINERAVLDYLERVPLSERTGSLDGVRLRLADGTVHAHEGTLDFADTGLAPETGTLRLRAVFPNPDRTVVSGFFAQVGMPLPGQTVMTVPSTSTLRDIQGPFVMVVNSEGTVERRDVVLGRRIGPDVVIESGLAEDERVIVRGLQRARPGSTVDPKPLGEGPQAGRTEAVAPASRGTASGSEAETTAGGDAAEPTGRGG
jgi:RND family efflux transporter MFP subunit